MHKRLIIVDISSFIFRAFFAIRPLSAPDGTPVNAVHGVLNMLLKLLEEYSPSHLFIAQDTGEKTFRSDLYPEYKSNRPEPPEALIPQFDIIHNILVELKLPHLSWPGYEADDIIGSAVAQWREQFEEILIASGDKDLMQLIGGNVKMVDTMKNITYDEKGVLEKMGVRPKQIVDYLSIVGDSSDNVPGMRGVGPKGAIKLLKEHENLDQCIALKDSFKGKALNRGFNEYLEDTLLSRKLVKIVTDIQLNVEVENLKYLLDPGPKALNLLQELGLKAVVARFEKMKGETPKEELKINITRVDSSKDFARLMSLVEETSIAAMEFFFDGDDPCRREITSIGLSLDGTEVFYLPAQSIDLDKLLAATYGQEKFEIYSSNCQMDVAYLLRTGRSFCAQKFDVIQAHFVVNADVESKLVPVVRRYFDIELEEFKKDKVIADSEEMAEKWIGERIYAIYRLAGELKKELKAKNVENVYYEIDAPLIPVLAGIEQAGVMINREFFLEFGEELEKKISAIEKKIQAHCDGEPINLNSPKQVSDLLFNRLKLPVVKKTKSGFSTDVEVLTILDSKNMSPIPGLMLQHRELGKLLSTYVRSLPDMVNPTSKRIHARFNQNIAATGRLSSNHPNLQNIPIRTEMGKRVRKGFIAHPGQLLFGADYSQVELRLLAHLSGDPVMQEAFRKDQDIHQQTAAEILGIPPEKITQNQRSYAKTVNFGLMYGQSSFGLASQLKISRQEAKDYITRYFSRFTEVKHYLDSLKEFAEEKGYSLTMMKRKRFLPDIRSSNRNLKAMAQRVAINSPIQGSAADIIKMAMVKIQREIKRQKLETKMILQVHDELIFEVSEEELETTKSLVIDTMENIAGPGLYLKVDTAVGVSWFDLK